MGIHGLWEALEPASSEVSLLALALNDRYNGPPPHLAYTIGIDVSIWFEQCQQQLWHRANPRSGQSPPLRSFLFRLARLAQLPVHLVFCYDGEARPHVKRGKKVDTRAHWMTRPTQRILDAFNVPWLTALGEAEAELTRMNQAGIIDAVMTDDSDSFVFGAHTVLRNSSFDARGFIKVYTTEAIQREVADLLCGDAFALMALCCGGDYDTGLRGCGMTTALGLVQCGLSNGVRQVLSNGPEMENVLDDWRRRLRDHLLHDPANQLGRRHPALAVSIPDTFPPPDVIRYYLDPVVTTHRMMISREPQPPDLAAVASLVREFLGWEDVKQMLTTFASNIWPTVILKEILLDLSRCSPHGNEFDLATGCTRAAFLAFPQSRSTRHGVPGMLISLPTAALRRDTLRDLPDCLHDPGNVNVMSKVSIWVPSRIFDGWTHTMFMGGSTTSGHAEVIEARDNDIIDLTVDDEPTPSSSGSQIIDLTHDED